MPDTSVNHTQRLIVQAIDTLSQLEGRLRTRMSVPDVVAMVDDLIVSLNGLVARAGEGDPNAASSLAEVKSELAAQSEVRGQGQKDRLCAS